ncbi:MAG: hypothetical protein PVJ57_21440 [Phycisphaerae bacterium]|jgi:hypothetical protein
MNREAFEQLVNAWLDEPERDDLLRQIEAAEREEPPLAVIRIQLRLVELHVSRLRDVELPIAWDRQRRRVAEAVASADDATGADARLDAELLTLPGVADRVNWTVLRQRISAAVADTASVRRVRPLWRVAAAAGVLATAAGLLGLLLTFPPTPVVAPRGIVSVTVLAQMPATDKAAGVVRVQVMEDAGAPKVSPVVEPTESAPEAFFMLSPPKGMLALAPAEGSSAH